MIVEGQQLRFCAGLADKVPSRMRARNYQEGGNMKKVSCAAAHAVWRSTDGETYITPEVLEGRERLRGGQWQ
jgi:hypothetical protein